MNNKKKLLFISVCIALAFSFFSCKDSPEKEDNAGSVSNLSLIAGKNEISAEWDLNNITDETIVINISPCPDDSLFPAGASNSNYYKNNGKEFNSYLFTNLEENVEYTVNISVLNSSGKQLNTISSAITTKDNNNIVTIDCTDGSYIHKIDNNINFVVLENANNFNLSYSVINNGADIVNAANTKSMIDCALVESSLQSNENQINKNRFVARHFVAPEKVLIGNEDFSRAAKSSIADCFDYNNLTTDGKTYKYFYVDNDINGKYNYTQFYLRAIGKNSSGDNVCLLWVDEDSWSDGEAKDLVINQAVANQLTEEFVKRYEEEREVFGEESENLFDINNTEGEYTVSITENSDTKSLVNIVVYDIGGDKESLENGLMGYFWGKDYYVKHSGSHYYKKYGFEAGDITNEGKFFYVDAPFCNLAGYNEDGNCDFGGCKDSAGNVCASGDITSTLIHEFQHMINFNQKDSIEDNNEEYEQTWHNEMLSMLAEDIFQEAMGLSDDAAPRSRFSNFNYYYNCSGLTEYLEEDSFISYATSYALGSYIVRNYGGVKLIKEMSQNEYVNMECILNAIKTVTGKEITEQQLINECVQSVSFRPEFSVAHNLPTHYTEGESYETTDGTELTLTKINICDSNSGNVLNNNYYYGPLYFNYYYKTDLRSNGFALHMIGNVKKDNKFILSFNSISDSNQCLYLYVQDIFDVTVEDKIEE